MHCPKWYSNNIVKNGCTHYGKQRFKCRDCGRQFVENATRQPIDNATRELIDKLLLERLSLRAIVRVTGVSLRWLQYYVNQKYYQVPKNVEVTKKNRAGWRYRLMKCGHTCGRKPINNGYGLQLMRQREKLLGYILEIVLANQQNNCGVLFHQFIGNELFVTQIFWKHMNRFYLVLDIKL